MHGLLTTESFASPSPPCPTGILGGLLIPTYGNRASPVVAAQLAHGVTWCTLNLPNPAPFGRGSQPLPLTLGASSHLLRNTMADLYVETTITQHAPTPATAVEPTSVSVAAADIHRSSAASPRPQPPSLSNDSDLSCNSFLDVHTPVQVSRFIQLLSSHPNQEFRNYVCSGMLRGFSIGNTCTLQHHLTSPNHPSACNNASFVTTYLQSCCERGETAGPFPSPPFPCMQVSGLGAIPKSNGKLRIIHDLSSPAGQSVNDGISRSEFSLHYETVDTAIAYIMQLGRGSLLTKVDIRNAFRLCPVSPADWPYLGISWQGQFFFDKVLPFGLRSAPFIFDKFASALQWILEDTCRLRHLLHYLDDFLKVSTPAQAVAQRHRSLILDMFQYLRVPVAPEKVEGPSTCLTFLGLELDLSKSVSPKQSRKPIWLQSRPFSSPTRCLNANSPLCWATSHSWLEPFQQVGHSYAACTTSTGQLRVSPSTNVSRSHPVHKATCTGGATP